MFLFSSLETNVRFECGFEYLFWGLFMGGEDWDRCPKRSHSGVPASAGVISIVWTCIPAQEHWHLWVAGQWDPWSLWASDGCEDVCEENVAVNGTVGCEVRCVNVRCSSISWRMAFLQKVTGTSVTLLWAPCHSHPFVCPVHLYWWLPWAVESKGKTCLLFIGEVRTIGK